MGRNRRTTLDDLKNADWHQVRLLEDLKATGLQWKIIMSLRDVTMDTGKLAGAVLSDKPGLWTNRRTLQQALRDDRSYVELTLLLSLYSDFDANGRAHGHTVVDPRALLSAWQAYTTSQPDHRLHIQHAFLAARAYLERDITIRPCTVPSCGYPVLEFSERIDFGEDFSDTIGRCPLCVIRRDLRVVRMGGHDHSVRGGNAGAAGGKRPVTLPPGEWDEDLLYDEQQAVQ